MIAGLEKQNPAGRPGFAGCQSEQAGNDDHTALPADLNQAAQFLRALDPTAKSFHFRVIHPDGISRPRNYVGSLDELAIQLQLDNGNGYGVYVVVNEGGHRSDQVVRVRAAFADFDDPQIVRGLDPRSLLIGGREPHIVVQSSPDRLHVYWLLNGLSLDQFTPLQKAISARLGADKQVTDLPRVMRVPGFLNTKRGIKATLLRVRAHQAFAAAEMLSAFPPGDHPSPPSPAAAAQTTPFAFSQDHSPSSRYSDYGKVVTTARHDDVLQLSAQFARKVCFEGLSRDSALSALYAERERGRWTRAILESEITAALDGAIAKCRSGDWKAIYAPDTLTHEEPTRGLIEVDLANFMAATDCAPQFIFNPIVPRGEVTLLGGHGGAGKSTLALTLCALAANGQAFAAFGCDAVTRAVFVSLEDSGDQVRHRLRNIVEVYGLDASMIEQNLRVLDGADVDASLVTEVSEQGTRKLRPTPRFSELKKAVAGFELIVIDNTSDTYEGDENKRPHVRFYLRLFKSTARENNPGVILLAHIDKNAAMHGSRGNSYSGSTAWHNSVRSRLALLTDLDKIELRHEKANLSKQAGHTYLEWANDRRDSGVLVPSVVDVALIEASTAIQIRRDADELLKVLAVAAEAGVQVPSAMKGPSTASHALEKLPEFPAVYRTRAGRKRVEAAVVQLLRDKRLVHSEIKTSSRNTRELLVMTQSGMDALDKLRASIPPTPSVTDARA